MDASHITVAEPPLLHIATRYTGEAGVRSLEHAVGGVVRYKAVELAEHLVALASQQEGTASSFRGTNMIELSRNRLTGGLGDACHAFFFASNCADVLTLFFPVLGDQREWRASTKLGEKLCS